MRVFRTLFGLLIGLAFILGGVAILMETAIPNYQMWKTMQSWQPGIAMLSSVTGSEDNAEASYRYKVDGFKYENDRVYLAPFKDTIGGYHQQMNQRLHNLYDSEEPISIWFDPDKPEHSIIDREMRWGLFVFMIGFCSVFILIGLVICYSFLTSKNNKSNDARKLTLLEVRKPWNKQQLEDDQESGRVDEQPFDESGQDNFTDKKLNYSSNERLKPWLQKKEWQNNQISSNSKTNMIIMWVFAAFWNVLSFPLLFVFEDEINKGNYIILVALLFPLVGLFLLKKAWQITREWQRFGEIVLVMDPFPGSIGGHIGGSLLLKNVLDYNTNYKVVLECVYSYVSGSGKRRSRRERIKWAEAGLAKIKVEGGGIKLKFRFSVPYDLPESDLNPGRKYYFWRFKVNSEQSRVNLSKEYHIPVFKTKAQSTSIGHDISAQVIKTREQKALETQAAVLSGDFSSTALARAFIYKDKGNEQIFYFPMFRNKLLTFIAVLFAGGFCFAAYSINQGFVDEGIINYFLLIFSIPFAIVGLIASIAMIYLPFNNLSITLEGRKIEAIRRLFIFPIKHNIIHSAEIKQIEVKSSGSTGQGVSQVKHYKLIVLTNLGKKVTIAEDLDGEDLANQLKEFICKRLLINPEICDLTDFS